MAGQPATADVDHDPLEPGPELRRVPEAAKGAPGAHRGVVGRILRVDRIPEDDAGQTVAAQHLDVEQPGKGLGPTLVALAGPVTFVHRAPLS